MARLSPQKVVREQSPDSGESRSRTRKDTQSNVKSRAALEVYTKSAGLPAGRNQREVAPLHKIEQIKTNTKKMEENNNQLRRTIESLDENNHKIAKHVTELKRKTLQAKNDKIELLRDLATYEANFAKKSQFKDGVHDLIQKLSRQVRRIQEVNATSSATGGDPQPADDSGAPPALLGAFLRRSQLSALSADLQALQDIKRQRNPVGATDSAPPATQQNETAG